jgi:SAM-dependent methyltransferase
LAETTPGSEFTGERVIPGEVGPDLWNEHLARYLFAARLTPDKRVLDLGCGTGYGTAELARTASWAIGIDRAPEAIAYAGEHYRGPNLRFQTASCEAVPFPDGTFDLLVAFEVIEHLENWKGLLGEARRLLAPGGLFVVSTPNRVYYAESREGTGPNPFHVHEFDYEEFRRELGAFFPHLALYVQNHAAGVVIGGEDRGDPEVAVGARRIDTQSANFFLAVASEAPFRPPSSFLLLPGSGNALRERQQHIARLEAQVAEGLERHRQMVERFREQHAALEQSNRWAEELKAELEAAGRRIEELQGQLEQSNQWATGLDRQLAECAALLDKAEATVVERTEWGQRLDQEVQHLRGLVEMARGSRWVRLGKKLGVGPPLGEAPRS